MQRILKEQGAKAVQAVGRAGSLVPGLAPASPEDAFEDFVPVPRSPVYQNPAPSPQVMPVHAAEILPVAQPQLQPTVPVAPLFEAPPPASPRMEEGQVSFTRGGIGARPVFAPLEDRPEPMVAAPAPVQPEARTGSRQALLEALGELESARAAIGRVLATRDRLSGD